MAPWPDADPRQSCLILDFDGVLAPIVADPAQSAMPESTREILTGLVARLGRVAIVSGRSASFLAERVMIDGVDLVGLYGLEHVEQGEVVPDPRIEPFLDDLDRARRVLTETIAEWPGSELEDKGRALAVHWRRAKSGEQAAAPLEAAVREVAGDLMVEEGKMVVELRPPVAADKGTAVAMLAEEYVAVAYGGDDVGDLPAFAEVARRGGTVVAVDHGEETDDRVIDGATVVVDGTQGMAEWLQDLLERVSD